MRLADRIYNVKDFVLCEVGNGFIITWQFKLMSVFRALLQRYTVSYSSDSNYSIQVLYCRVRLGFLISLHFACDVVVYGALLMSSTIPVDLEGCERQTAAEPPI